MPSFLACGNLGSAPHVSRGSGVRIPLDPPKAPVIIAIAGVSPFLE